MTQEMDARVKGQYTGGAEIDFIIGRHLRRAHLDRKNDLCRIKEDYIGLALPEFQISHEYCKMFPEFLGD